MGAGEVERDDRSVGGEKVLTSGGECGILFMWDGNPRTKQVDDRYPQPSGFSPDGGGGALPDARLENPVVVRLPSGESSGGFVYMEVT